MGSALTHKNQLERALSHYLEALRIRPDDPTGHYGIGIVYTKLGNFDKAVHHYREAIEMNPEHVNAHTGLGVVLAKQGRFDDAIFYYRRDVLPIATRLCNENVRRVPVTLKSFGYADAKQNKTTCGQYAEQDLTPRHTILSNHLKLYPI